MENVLINKIENGFIVQVEPSQSSDPLSFYRGRSDVPKRFIFKDALELAEFIYIFYGAEENKDSVGEPEIDLESDFLSLTLPKANPHSDMVSESFVDNLLRALRKKGGA